ncbi:MAG TPA: hypothetical protein VND22_06375 [Actinomycetota bacterium]|nr:hypothetical protein [Actinomycetota bacterium]
MAEDVVTPAHLEEPPANLKISYYLWDVRIPPTWREWAERDIASPNWIYREVFRYVATILMLGVISDRMFSPLVIGFLAVGVMAILVAQEPLRKVAVAYQRYGWEWATAPRLGVGPYVRSGLALVFSVVFAVMALMVISRLA